MRCFIGALGDFLNLLLNMVLIHVDVMERAARLHLHSLTRRDECVPPSLSCYIGNLQQGSDNLELRDQVSHALAMLVEIDKIPFEPLSPSWTGSLEFFMS